MTFTFTVQNPSGVTITLQTLSPGESYVCSIQAEVTGAPGAYQNTVTTQGVDLYQNPLLATATAEVRLVSLAPGIAVTKVAAPASIKEPGGLTVYTVTVTNNSGPSDPVALTSLQDSIYGNLTDLNNTKIKESTCQLVTIQPRQTYTCTFKAQVSGASGPKIIDTVTATGADDEGTAVQALDDAMVQLDPCRPDPGRLWCGPAGAHGQTDACARHRQPQPASCPAHADTPTLRTCAAFSLAPDSSTAAHLTILPRPDQDQHHLGLDHEERRDL